MKRIRPYWIYYGAGLTGADWVWLNGLQRSTGRLVPGWRFWEWQFVRPNYAYLSKRGWLCFNEDSLPAHEKLAVVCRPLPDMMEFEESPCAVEGCGC